jgi:carboxylate-amine ligase
VEADAVAAFDGAAVRSAFDGIRPFTIGLEEEVLLVDPVTYLPVPVTDAVLARTEPEAAVMPELPASQVEIISTPHERVADAIGELRTGRRALAAAACGVGRPVAAAVHPTAPGLADLAPSQRAAALGARYGTIAAQQLVGALQVHVAVGSADATLAVYNALRGHLPELAALAAAAPFHAGRDTGLASARPLVSAQLPRQGVPPVMESWDRFAEDLEWGARSGAVPEPGWWWWELRPHVRFGTLEIRVPDVQPTLGHAEALATAAHALVRHLGRRHAAGEELGRPSTWRIAENRFESLRHGVEGRQFDLITGDARSTRRCLHDLLDRIEPDAVGSLHGARALVERNSAMELRAVGLHDAVPWLADSFLAGTDSR